MTIDLYSLTTGEPYAPPADPRIDVVELALNLVGSLLVWAPVVIWACWRAR